MSFADDALALLKHGVKKYGSAHRLEKVVGLGGNSITRWMNGRAGSSIEFGRLCDFLGARLVLDEENELFASVPKVKAKAGAGSSLIVDGEIQGYYKFRVSFFQRMCISEKDSVLMEVIGDSMSPTINNGDVVLIDQSKNEMKDNAIFVVGFGEELLCKRLFKVPSGIVLRSDNTNYPDITVAKEDIEQFRIYGKVKWLGKVFLD